MPLEEHDLTLTCVSNTVGGPYCGNARWLGAPLAPLLRRAGVQAGADQILSTSFDGMTIGTPVEAVLDGRQAMLAVAMNGQTLPVEHGFPVPDAGSRPVRVRLGDQVGRRSRTHHLRRGRRLLGG